MRLTETALAEVALVEIPVTFGVPVIADRAYDSDSLREELAEDGFIWCPRTARITSSPRPTTAGVCDDTNGDSSWSGRLRGAPLPPSIDPIRETCIPV